jgi:hypothetical protein
VKLSCPAALLGLVLGIAGCGTSPVAPRASATRTAARATHTTPGVVDVNCPPRDIGGRGVAIHSAKRGWSTPEEALSRYVGRRYYYPMPLPEAHYFHRAAERPRWVPLVFRHENRILVVVRTFKSPLGWTVRYVYACDSALTT